MTTKSVTSGTTTNATNGTTKTPSDLGDNKLKDSESIRTIVPKTDSIQGSGPDKNVNREVVYTEVLPCKVIYKNKAPGDYSAKFLPRELAILRKLKHPNILEINNIIESNDKVFLFEEQVEDNLLNYLLKNGAQRENEARRIFRDVVQGMQYCHSQDVGHRGLKLEHLLIDQNGTIKISGFGFARFCSDPDSGKQVLSKTFCGSAPYVPPEVFRHAAYRPQKYDVWSMGCILFAIVSNAFPFNSARTGEMVKKQLTKDIHFPRAVSKKISEQCTSLILKILEPDPRQRPTTTQIWNSKWVQGLPPTPRSSGQEKQLKETETKPKEEEKPKKEEKPEKEKPMILASEEDDDDDEEFNVSFDVDIGCKEYGF